MAFLILLLLVGVAWSIWNAVLAHQRGRGPIRWFLISLVISPLLVTIVLALMKRPGLRIVDDETEQRRTDLLRQEAAHCRRLAERSGRP
jgi:hypothetical protein